MTAFNYANEFLQWVFLLVILAGVNGATKAISQLQDLKIKELDEQIKGHKK